MQRIGTAVYIPEKYGLLSRLLGYFICGLMGTITALCFIVFHGLASTAPIMFDDYPIHYYRSYLLKNMLIPRFGGVFGFSPYFYAGSPEIHMYPIGFYILNVIVSSILGLDMWTAIRIVLFISIVLSVYLPYIVARRAGFSPILSLIAPLWYIIGAGNSQWLNFTLYGMLAYNFSVFVTIMFVIKIFEISALFDRKSKVKYRDIAVSSFLFFLILMFNFMTLLFLVIFFIIYLLIHLPRKNGLIQKVRCLFSESERCGFLIKNLFFICFLGTMLAMFWLLPSIMIQLPMMDVANAPTHKIFSSSFGIWYTLDIISRQSFNIAAFCLFSAIILLLGYMRKKIFLFKTLISDREECLTGNVRRGLFLFAIVTLVFVITVPFLRIGIFSGINSYRYYSFFEVLIPIIALYGSSELSSYIGLLYRKKRILSDKSRRFRASSLIKSKHFTFVLLGFNILGYFFMFTNALPFVPVENSVGYILSVPGSPLEGFDMTRPGTNLTDVIDWIINNTDNSSRIMMENSGESTGFLLGGHVMGYVALKTHRYFIGGYLTHYWYKFADMSTFKEGKVFGVNITEADPGFVVDMCNIYNVEYIITRLDISKKIFTNWSLERPELFVKVGDIGPFGIFRVTNPVKSWITSNNPSVIAENVNFLETPDEISFIISNLTEKDVIRVSLHSFPNWKILCNGSTDNVEMIGNSLGLIEFRISGATVENSYNIRIVWRKTIIEVASDGISFVAFCIIPFVPYIGKKFMKLWGDCIYPVKKIKFRRARYK